jgi:YD repeat-containing protein
MTFSVHRVADADGEYVVDPDSCSHVYGYDGSGNLITDTATTPKAHDTYVKTYTYTSGRLTGESAWVKQ